MYLTVYRRSFRLMVKQIIRGSIFAALDYERRRMCIRYDIHMFNYHVLFL